MVEVVHNTDENAMAQYLEMCFLRLDATGQIVCENVKMPVVGVFRSFHCFSAYLSQYMQLFEFLRCFRRPCLANNTAKPEGYGTAAKRHINTALLIDNGKQEGSGSSPDTAYRSGKSNARSAKMGGEQFGRIGVFQYNADIENKGEESQHDNKKIGRHALPQGDDAHQQG